jgi:hypothetical protein
VSGRVEAATGCLPQGVERVFSEPSLDVPNAGVLCALPALIENGLISGVEERHLHLSRVYYPALTYLLFTAYLILVRARVLERLRYGEPGEWGILLGHDRCPEVKTMRQRLDCLAQSGQVEAWMSSLMSRWTESHPETEGVLYVDGHVRLYHGTQTRLPARFVSRQRLCLRSQVDYWVNDQEGRPFFVLTAVDTEGLLAHLRNDLIPRLIADIPHQPSAAELEADSNRHRFTVIVDREGFSPAAMREFFATHRVALTTYRRHPYDDWPESDFTIQTVPLAHGLSEIMRLSARPYGDPADGLTEIRRLTDRGTQSAIITADRTTPWAQIAGRQFSRWSQENYFRYASEEFGIDRLVSYGKEDAPDTTTVVNPVWKQHDAAIRKLRREANRIRVTQAGMTPPPDLDDQAAAAWLQRRQQLDERLKTIDQDLAHHKEQRKASPKRITIDQLPEADRPHLIGHTRKRLLDTVAMIAYRAECAQTLIVRDQLARSEDARALVKSLYKTTGDILPDPKNKTLTVCLHRGANALSDRAIQGLLAVLNDSETCYPGTDMRLKYELVPLADPAGQEV